MACTCYIIHYPRTIVRLGPMVRSWCMRFESKHTYFKQVAVSLGNFINVPFTVAERHQKLQSLYYFYGEDQKSSIVKPLECGPGSQHSVLHDPSKEELKQIDGHLNDQDLVYKTSWVKILGTLYKIGAIIHVGFNNFLPVFAEIKSIHVLNSSIERVYFAAEILYTKEFCEHYRTYVVNRTVHPEIQFYPQRSLQYYLPLHILNPVCSHNQTHVLPKCDIHNYN